MRCTAARQATGTGSQVVSIETLFSEDDNPATTGVYVKPGKYDGNLVSKDYDDNLFSEDHAENTFSEEQHHHLHQNKTYRIERNSTDVDFQEPPQSCRG